MKTIKINLFAVILGILALTACSENKEITTVPEKEITEVEFQFNIGDLGNFTKTQHEVETPVCKSIEELRELAKTGDLYASILLKNNSTGALIPSLLRIRPITGDLLQTDAFSLDLGKYTIMEAFIKNKANTIIYFAGVLSDSDYAAYIQPEFHMEKQYIELTEEHKYKKTPFPIWVLCAESSTPEDFGFVKWNVNFVKSICFPIMVNYCDDIDDDHQPAGHIQVRYKKQSEPDSKFVTLHKELPFGPGKPGSICFKDDYQELNENEIHEITIVIYKKYSTTQEELFHDTVLLSTAELKKYKQHPDWVTEFNFMHINFCNCKTWEFDCEKALQNK